MATSSSVGSSSFSEERERNALKEEPYDNKSWEKKFPLECRVCAVSGFDPAVKETLQIAWNVAKKRKWKAFKNISFPPPPPPPQTRNPFISGKIQQNPSLSTFIFYKGEGKIHLQGKEREEKHSCKESIDYVELNSGEVNNSSSSPGLRFPGLIPIWLISFWKTLTKLLSKTSIPWRAFLKNVCNVCQHSILRLCIKKTMQEIFCFD